MTSNGVANGVNGINGINDINGINGTNGLNGMNSTSSVNGTAGKMRTRRRIVIVGLGMVAIAFMLVFYNRVLKSSLAANPGNT